MNKLHTLALAIAATSLCSLATAQTTQRAGASPGVNAQQETMSLENMKRIDANGDGMISREEHMKMAAAAFDRMKKMPNGMVDMKVYQEWFSVNGDPYRPMTPSK